MSPVANPNQRTRIQKAPITQVPSSARLYQTDGGKPNEQLPEPGSLRGQQKKDLLKSGVQRRMEGVVYNTNR
tara:strand:- start:938 stop:1153 length:216 start_codon:yes stop_codon:yes gene_type:complete